MKQTIGNHRGLVLASTIAAIGVMIIPLTIASVYSQTMSSSSNITTNDNATTTPQQQMPQQKHLAHEFHNLIISQYVPLTGQLSRGDYLLLADLTPFATSVEGHSHIALKIPCENNGKPKAAVLTGVAPNLTTPDIGNSINNGTLNGKPLDLSSKGKSCLYHAGLPKGITDIALANTSPEDLNFGQIGGYSVTITVHGTAIEHKG